jgi:hypothetical protein
VQVRRCQAKASIIAKNFRIVTSGWSLSHGERERRRDSEREREGGGEKGWGARLGATRTKAAREARGLRGSVGGSLGRPGLGGREGGREGETQVREGEREGLVMERGRDAFTRPEHFPLLSHPAGNGRRAPRLPSRDTSESHGLHPQAEGRILFKLVTPVGHYRDRILSAPTSCHGKCSDKLSR